MHGMTKNGIKAKSFVHNNKLPPIYKSSINTVHITYSSQPPCQNTTQSINVKIRILAFTRDQYDTTRKLLTLSCIYDFYPQDTWIRIYADGSATDAIQHGGADSVLYLLNGDTIEPATATNKHCTHYAVEVKSLSQGVQALLDIAENHKEDVVFLTNSKSVLDALASHRE